MTRHPAAGVSIVSFWIDVAALAYVIFTGGVLSAAILESHK